MLVAVEVDVVVLVIVLVVLGKLLALAGLLPWARTDCCCR